MTVLAFKPRPTEPAPSPHYLIFNASKEITGCGCGHPAHPDDHGYGNSIVAHLLEQGTGT